MENAKCYAPQILVGTEGLPREQWLEYRRKGIGGSDAAAVLGISPFRIDDLGFARLTMHPRKSMIHCFQYISRKAWDYVQDELKANGVQPGPGQQAYGCDIPDDLCYQWAEDYFRDPNAKEDQGDEEEFVPQPYRGKTSSKSVSKKKKEEKKNKPEKKESPKKAEADDGQISLGDLSSFGEAA